MKKFVTLFDGEKMDISELSVNQLFELNYEQEVAFAELIKKAKPFSAERDILLKNGYETIIKIARVRKEKEGMSTISFGAQKQYIKLVEKIINKIISNKEKVCFFEAGVGAGLIINAVAKIKNVIAMGCDVYIDKNVISLDNSTIYESTICEALSKLPDNSIDVFYWNDVLEHIPEDEVEEHIKLIHRKISNGGIIITITPNRLIGPHDITRRFSPPGTVAKGFHFHEYTFHEIMVLFEKFNFKSAYGFLGFFKGKYYILGYAKIIDKMKLLTEKILAANKNMISRMGCNISIFYKKEDKK